MLFFLSKTEKNKVQNKVYQGFASIYFALGDVVPI